MMPSAGARITVRSSTDCAARACSSTSAIVARSVLSSATASSTRLVVSRSICCLRLDDLRRRAGDLRLQRPDLADQLGLGAQQRGVFGAVGEAAVEQQLLAVDLVAHDRQLIGARLLLPLEAGDRLVQGRDALVQDLTLGDVAGVAGSELDLLLGDDVVEAYGARRSARCRPGCRASP